MFKYFDSHCHPYMLQFDADREAVLARMEADRVGAIVVGADLKESRKAVALAETRDFLWASVGLHPTDNVEEVFDMDAYRLLAAHPKVVAIGECGLDYYRAHDEAAAKAGGEILDELKALQKERFLAQLKLSIEIGKSLIIHCRPSLRTTDAHDDMLDILGRFFSRGDTSREWLPPIIHFFTSTKEIAEKYLSLGCYISFPGVITFADLDDAVRAVPLDRILTETDSPFAAPKPYRGTRNEPAFVIKVAKKIAEVKNIPVEDVGNQIVLNSQRAFRI